MPSIITHGIVALAVAAKAKGIRATERKSLLLLCALLAMLPDIDVIGFKLGVQYNSMFGHRGFTHSFFFAALVALITSWLLHRRKNETPQSFGWLFLLLFAVCASHPLLDAMTDGGEGIAFFAPFSNHRFFFPYRPIMVSPIGIEAFLGLRGLLVLANEFLLVLFPLAVVLYFPAIWKHARTKWLMSSILLAVWLASLAILTGLHPLNSVSMTLSHTGHPKIDLFVKQYRNKNALLPIPVADLPGGELATNFLKFQKMGLYNRRLEAFSAEDHWASGFFPNWFGGIAGRWQDSNFTLTLRTLFGYGVPDSRVIQEVLKESTLSQEKRDFLFRLSPTEKYDLSIADYGFTATRTILAFTHNAAAWPKFWYGICNGMAAASLWHKEPFRAVDVINPNGFKVRFHPNDVKALLGYAMAEVSMWTEVGVRCNINGSEAESCRVNPGSFFLATMNRIGLAKHGFIVDGFSGTRKQFYLFDAVRVEVLQPPTPVSEMKEWAVPTPVKSLARVRFTMEFVSTLLSDKDSTEADSTKADGYFKKVGRKVVPRVLEAWLALNKDGDVIGGSWLGDEDVPDVIFFPSATPSMDNQNRLKSSPALNWDVIRQIYEQSISTSEKQEPVDFSL